MAALPPQREAELFELRPRLVRFFASRGRGWAADELADDAIMRVLERLSDGLPIENLAAFTLGVARNVWLEHLRSSAKDPAPLPEVLPDIAVGTEPETSAELDDLERCLRQMPADARALILQYYGDAEAGKPKQVRAKLAADLGLTMNALLLRVSRLRRDLRACMGLERQDSGPRDTTGKEAPV